MSSTFRNYYKNALFAILFTQFTSIFKKWRWKREKNRNFWVKSILDHKLAKWSDFWLKNNVGVDHFGPKFPQPNFVIEPQFNIIMNYCRISVRKFVHFWFTKDLIFFSIYHQNHHLALSKPVNTILFYLFFQYIAIYCRWNDFIHLFKCILTMISCFASTLWRWRIRIQASVRVCLCNFNVSLVACECERNHFNFSRVHPNLHEGPLMLIQTRQSAYYNLHSNESHSVHLCAFLLHFSFKKSIKLDTTNSFYWNADSKAIAPYSRVCPSEMYELLINELLYAFSFSSL